MLDNELIRLPLFKGGSADLEGLRDGGSAHEVLGRRRRLGARARVRAHLAALRLQESPLTVNSDILTLKLILRH